MLDLVGDSLNWAGAAVLFPLMFLPLGALIAQSRAGSTFAFVALVVGSLGAGLLFSYAAPIIAVDAIARPLAVFSMIFLILAAAIFAAGGAGPAARRLASVFEAIVSGASKTVMWLLLVMALVQFGVVLLRHVFGVNWIFMQESVTYLHAMVFLMAAGYALLTDDHVRVDIFYRSSPAPRKALIDLAGAYLFLFPVCLLILWTASPYVARSWAFFEGSADTSGIQGVFLLKTLIPAFAVLLAMAGFVMAHRAVSVLRKADA